MCGKRSSVVQRLKIRKAKLLKLLNGEQIGWNTSVKLHAELDHVKKLLIKKKVRKKSAHTTTYTAISNTNTKIKIKPPQKNDTPALKKECLRDFQSPLHSPHCEHTCTARGTKHQQQNQ